MAAVTCFNCGCDYSFSAKLSRAEICPKCQADLHVCLNCKFYDVSAPNQCREPQAEHVRDKEQANFCDYFNPKTKADTAEDKKRADEARKAWEQLFKKL